MKTFLVACLTSSLSFGLATREASAVNIVFGGDANQFTIEFVEIANPGNPADTTGVPNPAGSVADPYIISKYEISRDMITKANSAAGLGIGLPATSPPYDGPNRPATGISWFEAATFVNYLNTSTGNPVAYKFNAGSFEVWQPGDAGYDAENPYRNSQAAFFLPSADEWYKSAYYDALNSLYYDYPTGSNTTPVGTVGGTAPGTAVYNDGVAIPTGPADIDQAGGLSPYGTIGQGGNVFEWEESSGDLANDSAAGLRGLRGGASTQPGSLLSSSNRTTLPPGIVNDLIGFRVAGAIESIPEPAAPLLLVLGVIGLITRRQR